MTTKILSLVLAITLIGALVAQPVQAAALTYVAIGDSVAAGAGLPTGPSQEDRLCGRSTGGYPYLLAAKLGTQVTDLACSGAKTTAGISSSQSVTSGSTRYTLSAQIDRAFQNGVPNLITMTVGANDLAFSLGGKSVSWADFIRSCYEQECGGKLQTGALALQLTALQVKLGNVLREIKSRSGSSTPPRVLITEYYYPVSSTACFNGAISAQEANWINTQAFNLNKAIRQTVMATTKISSWFRGTYNFATYVPVNFNGHGLCSATPWIQGLSDPVPVHPNTYGQAAYADALYQYAR